MSWRLSSQVVDCSRLELLPLETPGRRWWSVASTALASSSCPSSADDDVQGRRQSAGGCQQGRLAPCRPHNGKPEHITRTGCAREHATSAVREAVGLCALTSWLNIRAERRHSVPTATGSVNFQGQVAHAAMHSVK